MFSKLRYLTRKNRESSTDGAASASTVVPAITEETFRITIPENIVPGEKFTVFAGGRNVNVRCPENTKPGEQLQIKLPVLNTNEEGSSTDKSALSDSASSASPPPPSDSSEVGPNKEPPPGTKKFQVLVPSNANPGLPFALLAGGMRVLVTCPAEARPGMKIVFDLPEGLLNRPDGPKSELAEIKLSYDKDGWMRTIRVDFRFQWTRLNDRNEIDDIRRFDVDRSAYVLKLDYLDDGDKRRKGRCSLVTAERGVVESWVKSIRDGSNIVSYSDVVNAQMMSYNDKIKWFQDTCVKLSEDWGKTYNKCKIISVRRDFLLQDSMVKVMSFSRRDMRTIWRIEYIGEEGLDAGGLAKEWFELVTNEVFNPDLGLWKMSEANQMSLEINPASGIMQEGHLVFYRFLGRVMGKGLFDQRLIKGHMVKHLYKHILGWPVMFNDLKDIDEEYYNNLKKLPSMGADVDCLGSNFTQTEDIPALNMKEEKEMIPNGASIDVTEENLPEYMEACLNYRLLGRYKEQVNELLLGFYDVIPEPLLTIFDFQELELLMCGLPVIDMDDWMKNTEYLSNFFPGYGPNHDVCRWFWEVVSEFDQEMKARLLQFVTGTSGVPPGGFGTLQGMSTGGGTGVRKFQICGIPLSMSNYPKSHTCFNRLDLPLYETRDDLEEKLKIAITMASTGFGIE